MWITLTEAALLTRIAGPELDAFRAAALGTGQADPVAATLAQMTRMVRGYCAACAQNTLGAGETIPDELLGAALDLLVLDIQRRAAGVVIDPADARMKAAERAVQLLRDVAACRFAIAAPATATTEEVGAPKPSFTDHPREWTREHEAGL